MNWIGKNREQYNRDGWLVAFAAMVNPSPQQQSGITSVQIPPLESGDRLTRHEFERRYEAMPHLKKAELIEGVVYVPAALRFRSHSLSSN